MTQDFVTVKNPYSEEVIGLPIDEDKSLLVSTLNRFFSTTKFCLAYQDSSTGVFCKLLSNENNTKFVQPSDGWQGKVFTLELESQGFTSTTSSNSVMEIGNLLNNMRIADSRAQSSMIGIESALSARKSPTYNSGDLIISNVTNDMTVHILYDHFAQFGNVIYISIFTKIFEDHMEHKAIVRFKSYNNEQAKQEARSSKQKVGDCEIDVHCQSDERYLKKSSVTKPPPNNSKIAPSIQKSIITTNTTPHSLAKYISSSSASSSSSSNFTECSDSYAMLECGKISASSSISTLSLSSYDLSEESANKESCDINQNN